MFVNPGAKNGFYIFLNKNQINYNKKKHVSFLTTTREGRS